LAGKAVLEPVQATANDVFGGRLAARLHVTAVHPHVGEPGNRACSTAAWSRIRLVRTSASMPSLARIRFTKASVAGSGAVLDIQHLDHRAAPRLIRCHHPLSLFERPATKRQPMLTGRFGGVPADRQARERTADLVVPAKQPVGGRQHLTAGITAHRGQPHRGPVEEQGGVAGRLQQVQNQEHGVWEQEWQD
jgi:hypothetical protein